MPSIRSRPPGIAPAPAPGGEPNVARDWPAWPSYGLITDLLPVLERWATAGNRAALATLVDVRGSSPRPLGSEMAINDAGEVAGYVSGGCVEGAVAAEAGAVLATGAPAMLDYGAGSPVLDVQLTCGGRIGIFVRALADLGAYAARLRSARDQRQAVDVTIDLNDGSHRFGALGHAGGRFFRQGYTPPLRLLIAGGDPVTLALCQAAASFGYEVTLLRPYGPPVAPAATPLAQYDTRPLERALADIRFDGFTAVYTLTHDMAADHAVLAAALDSPAFCIGALGSRGKTTQRIELLRRSGIDEHAIARLNTPAGLDIGAREPVEIALSILAELTARRPCASAYML